MLHINSVSTICGASILVKVHHKHINARIIHPVNPQTLLLEIDLFPVNNCTQNSLNFIFVIFGKNTYLIWFYQILLLYLPHWNNVNKNVN